jgi:hypothetical protein
MQSQPFGAVPENRGGQSLHVALLANEAKYDVVRPPLRSLNHSLGSGDHADIPHHIDVSWASRRCGSIVLIFVAGK